MVDSSRIVDVAETSEKLLQRFTGGVNGGLTYSKGNQSTQYNLSALVAYPREGWAAQVGLTSTLSHSSGVTASTWNQVTFGTLHLLPWNHYFYAGVGSFLQSAEQEINLQTTVGGGIGRFLKNTNRTTIAVLGGFAWQSTSYKQSIVPIGTQNVAAGLIAGDVQLYRFNKTNLSLTATLLPAVSEPGRVFSPPTRRITSRSPATCPGRSRFMAIGTTSRRPTYPAATTALARGSPGHLAPAFEPHPRPIRRQAVEASQRHRWSRLGEATPAVQLAQ